LHSIFSSRRQAGGIRWRQGVGILGVEKHICITYSASALSIACSMALAITEKKA